MADLDALFGIHAAALQLQSRRMEVLASNIANADTPGYQARDIDFSKVMAQLADGSAAPAAAAPGSGATHPGHIPLDGSGNGGDAVAQAATVYRVPAQPSADGNTVDVQAEQAAYADAALHYQASLSFIDNRLRSLMTAITGS